MKDLSNTKKQVEIFCAFIIDFNNLNTTLSTMLSSNSDSENQRVTKIFDIISNFISQAKSTDDILAQLNFDTSDKRLNQMLNYVKVKLNSDKIESYKVVMAHYHKLKLTIHPENNQKAIFIEEIDNELIIKADPNVPISTQDLNFLNKIAKLSISNTVEIREANKDFKSLNFKNKLDELYCQKAYYFEQVFANTDVQIQRKLLEIITERQKIRKPDDKEVEALKSLDDINILSDIDTLTLKTSSNVSDHQAFEAFCKILRRNSNPNLIKKILKENIIMTAMFKTNSKTISPIYGIKKLFINAVYPYNEVITKRYMQLMEKDEFQFAEIIVESCADPEFKIAYDTYQKGQETKLFSELAHNVIAEITLNEITELTINRVIQVIKGFGLRESYSHSIFPQYTMLTMLEDIYYYVISNNLFKQTDLMASLDEYLFTRITASLNDKINVFTIDTRPNIYGVIASDIWFDISKIINDYNIDWIDTIYLKFNEIDIFNFTPGSRLQEINDKLDSSDLKHLPNNECLIICSDSGSKNFDQYLYDLFTRISKGLFTSRIKITQKRIEGSAFRKKEFPGLSKTDDLKIRKAIIDYMTLKTLNDKGSKYFTGVYRRKMTAVLKNIISIECSYEEIIEFTDANELTSILSIFKSKDDLDKLLKKALRYENSNEESLIIKHSQDYFNLTNSTTLINEL